MLEARPRYQTKKGPSKRGPFSFRQRKVRSRDSLADLLGAGIVGMGALPLLNNAKLAAVINWMLTDLSSATLAKIRG